jgi:pyruvate dehydrogenase E2 component (dihydrolipoamide acetyltransferase)
MIEFKLPDIGEGIAEGEIVKWLVSEGDQVKEDQPIFEVMTDKATVEIPSPRTGTIKKILAKEGDVIPVETVVVIIEEAGMAKPVKQPEPGGNGGRSAQVEEKKVDFVLLNESKKVTGNGQDGRVLATPATRKFARDNNVEISQVKGSGPGGRVNRQDISDFIEKGRRKDLKESRDLVVSGGTRDHSYSYTEASKEDEERVPFRGLRKKISENLLRSVQHAPHFMIADEVDMTELVIFRKDAKYHAEKKGIKLTYLPFIVKAVVAALKEFPSLNSVLDEDKSELVLKKYYNIGVAVATAQGLIVPVLKNADRKSIFETAKELELLANQTREGKIEVENLRGGTFTITNIGSIGGLFSSPIINYPEVAILAVNKIVEKPVIKDGQIMARSMMYLSMSCDHRVVDGAIAALFLNRVIELLQNPKLLFLE